jgi:hypothetical protein
MRTLLGMMRTLLGISVAAFIAITVWSNLPIHAHPYGGPMLGPGGALLGK